MKLKNPLFNTLNRLQEKLQENPLVSEIPLRARNTLYVS
jgi:hypothetical protein